MNRELVEVINYALAAYKKGDMDVSRIFAHTPTDNNGWQTRFVMRCIEHYRPDIQNVQPVSSPIDSRSNDQNAVRL